MIVTILRTRIDATVRTDDAGNTYFRTHQAIAIHGLGESKFVDHLYNVYENGSTFLADGGAWGSEPALCEAFDAYKSDFETSIRLPKKVEA